MHLSTKGRHAVDALIDLSLREAAGPVALATIAARQQVSLSYLEQLFAKLRREGIVVATRGPGGGYTLGRAPADISVADIVCTVDDPLTSDARGTLSGPLWQRLGEHLVEHMAAVTLHSLVDEQRAAGAVVAERPAPRPVVPARQRQQPPRVRVPNSVFAFGQSFAH